MESVHAGSEDLEMFPNQGLNLHPTEYLFDRSHSLFDFASPLRAYNHCASPGGFLNPENFPHIPEPKDTPTRLIAAMGEQPKDLMAASAGIEIRQAPAVEIVVEKEKDRSGDLSGRKKISTQKFNPRKRQHPERSLPSQAKPRRKLGKARLEKNRISAREFRLKRKTYIGSLEEQVDMLQKRLFDYQNELNQYKAKEQEEMLEHLNKQEESTQDLSCSVAAKTGFNEQSLNSYIVYYSVILGRLHIKCGKEGKGGESLETEDAAVDASGFCQIPHVECRVGQEHLQVSLGQSESCC
eukprot:TRINITY_DN536_c0_g1_i11.p1 TRINITY_DN536_c0_g1~~TRINITY_DN536_c0_g1_i11.p1  ORF type:complete len:296 (+),score=45.66 TRINITY_DN536_c0_g1_i11:413-1300(+)